MTAPRGAERVRAAFDRAAADGRAAFVAYLVAGYPSEAAGIAAAGEALRCGADLLEVGVPFSDPLADGPTIAEAGRAALDAGSGLEAAVRTVAALRAAGHEQPLLVMTYLNPLVAAGERAALVALAGAGADGLIVPDLPAGELPRFERMAAALGLALTFLVAPNTARERLGRAIAASSGFLYVVPLFGVTGAREQIAAGAVSLLERVRGVAAGRVPVAAGFGISTRDHVAPLAAAADGVIVGSALVAALRDGGPERVGALVAELREGTRRSR